MTHRTVFVAREHELALLDGFLDPAFDGRGQVCFVTGEAGTGKTALVTEFARRAQETHPDLVVAYGQCNAHTGIGDPYLPFREILQQLTGDVEEKLASGTITEENASRLGRLLFLSGRALVEVGPDLIGLFLPGAGLVARLAALAVDEIEWEKKLQQLVSRHRQREPAASLDIEQSHIFEQYANVLQRLAQEVTLILILDDLQWTDAASAELLFHLGRRLRESRLLVIGTYRPEEVALGRLSTSTGQVERHPLEKTATEFKRYYGEILVKLGEEKEVERRRFVDAFLDTEPNQLGDRFRSALLKHTDGHPLFTVELLRDMQERSDLIFDTQGRWVEGPELDWDDLPARVEGVIEERIGRLSAELREELTVGSVEGESFTAEVVARIQELNARQLFRRFSQELERRHRLIQTQGVRQIDNQRLFLFRFSHNLFQVYLYNELTEAERICLHEEVGNALEALYGDRADEIAVQLARHFEEASIVDKAIRYLSLAGEQAAARYANDEAVAYFSRALDLMPQDAWAGRYALLLAREKVNSLRGDSEVWRQDLAALKDLAESLGDDQRLAEVALRQARFAEVTAEFSTAIAAAQECIRLAQACQAKDLEAAAHLEWGQALLHQGEYAAARTQLERALSLARTLDLRQVEARSIHNLGTISGFEGDIPTAVAYYEQALQLCNEIGERQTTGRLLISLGNAYSAQGIYDKAESYLNQALRICREIGDRDTEGGALANLGVVYADRGDWTRAKEYYEQCMLIKRETGDRAGEGMILMNLGNVLLGQGDHAKGKIYYEQSLGIFRELGYPRGTALVLLNLGVLSKDMGDFDSARHCYEQSLDVSRRSGYSGGEAWALTNLGLLYYHLGDDPSGLKLCEEALKLTREIGAHPIEACALTNLGHIHLRLGSLSDAVAAYQQAFRLRQESGQDALAMESLAGLARTCLTQGELSDAQAHVEEILAFLAADGPQRGTGHGLHGTDEPFWVYLTCYRVLRASEDPRAEDVLRTARGLLHEGAARISDEEMRRSFLENVAVHREILSEAVDR